jgi:hypothetical protein
MGEAMGSTHWQYKSAVAVGPPGGPAPAAGCCKCLSLCLLPADQMIGHVPDHVPDLVMGRTFGTADNVVQASCR